MEYSQSFSILNDCVRKFIYAVKNQNPEASATTRWTVSDVLRHIVFWHNYYANQYAALASGTKPYIFPSKGGSKRNQDGVMSFRHLSIENLIALLVKSQSSLYNSIVRAKVPAMDYTDRKRYKTEVFLDEIARHITRHTVQIRRAKIVSY